METKKEKKPLLLSFREIGLPKLILMLVAGLVLILLSIPDLIPNGNGKSSSDENTIVSNDGEGLEDTEEGKGTEGEYIKTLEGKLEKVLVSVKGVGKVKVMITLSSSKEKVTLKDTPYTNEESMEKDDAGGSREQSKVSKEEQSVLVEGESGSVPYVLKENEPVVEGILVVAEGGGDVTIQNEIIGAVEVLFNVPKHKIKVMKMNFE